MPTNTPAPKGSPRQVFGAALKFYRERADLTRDDLAARAHISVSTVRAYEGGWRVPTRSSVADIEAVAEMGSGGALLMLWDEFQDGMNYQALPAWVQDWAETIEPTAATLRWYEPLLVPALLETEDYMRAVYAGRFGITEDEIGQQVAARLKRQEILSRPKPPALWVIMDEGVLRRPVGGRHVMAEQIGRLIDAAAQPSIRIEVIELSTGAHEGLNGGFVLADFDDAPSVGSYDSAVSGQVVTERQTVAKLDVMWSTMRGEALPRGASVALLEEAKKKWTSQA
jgi:transcriptional regulator with XRE-family HTH domain